MNEPKRLSKEREAEIRKWTAKDVDHCYFCVELLAELDKVRGERDEYNNERKNAIDYCISLLTSELTVFDGMTALQYLKHENIEPIELKSVFKRMYDYHDCATDTLKSQLTRIKAERDLYKETIELKEQLLACYRVGKRPSEALFKKLDKNKATYEALTKGTKIANNEVESR